VFLTFFTSWLLLPAIPGAILGFMILAKGEKDSPYVPIYIIFLAVWGTVFFEFWKRKQNELAYELDMHIAKEQRKRIPSYRGQFSIEDVTHEIVIVDKRSQLLKYSKVDEMLI
jgi:anoctamin-10